jgi:hypothetical protein
MSWREQEDIFDQIDAASRRGYENGLKEVKGEIRALLIAYRALKLTSEQFILKIDELTKPQ